MKKQRPSQENIDTGIRYICANKAGRAVLQWLLNVECPTEDPIAEADFQRAESRRDLGRKLRSFISRNFDRKYIIDLEEEIHG